MGLDGSHLTGSQTGDAPGGIVSHNYPPRLLGSCH
jgi:hypothetical protein